MDSTQTIQNINNVIIKMPKDTIAIVAQKENSPVWLSFTKDVLIAYSWPIFFVFVIWLFRKPIMLILTFFAEFVKHMEKLAIEKYGISITRSSTTAVKPTIPSEPQSVGDVAPAATISSKMVGRILSTLWHYQKLFEDLSKRWTFTIGVFHADYNEFINAMRLLASQGLVAQDKNTQQFFLTDYGIFYCKQNETQLKEELFHFN